MCMPYTNVHRLKLQSYFHKKYLQSNLLFILFRIDGRKNKDKNNDVNAFCRKWKNDGRIWNVTDESMASSFIVIWVFLMAKHFLIIFSSSFSCLNPLFSYKACLNFHDLCCSGLQTSTAVLSVSANTSHHLLHYAMQGSLPFPRSANVHMLAGLPSSWPNFMQYWTTLYLTFMSLWCYIIHLISPEL